MYKKQIEEYFENNKDEMLNDICNIVRIKSDRGEAKENRMIYCIKKQSAITGRYSKKNKQD